MCIWSRHPLGDDCVVIDVILTECSGEGNMHGRLTLEVSSEQTCHQTRPIYLLQYCTIHEIVLRTLLDRLASKCNETTSTMYLLSSK
jgi:hypothetical protein